MYKIYEQRSKIYQILSDFAVGNYPTSLSHMYSYLFIGLFRASQENIYFCPIDENSFIISDP
jgi:hypothetical protein